MKRDFVPYEQALALKELGFDEPCLGHWNYNNGEINYWYNEEIENERTNKWFLNLEEQFPKMNKNGCSAPTFSQAFRWFRDKYGMEGVTQRAEDFMWYKWTIHQYNENSKKYVANWYKYKTYEEAELACLKRLIEICKNK